jgi:hypothetical protein
MKCPPFSRRISKTAEEVQPQNIKPKLDDLTAVILSDVAKLPPLEDAAYLSPCDRTLDRSIANEHLRGLGLATTRYPQQQRANFILLWIRMKA